MEEREREPKRRDDEVVEPQVEEAERDDAAEQAAAPADEPAEVTEAADSAASGAGSDGETAEAEPTPDEQADTSARRAEPDSGSEPSRTESGPTEAEAARDEQGEPSARHTRPDSRGESGPTDAPVRGARSGSGEESGPEPSRDEPVRPPTRGPRPVRGESAGGPQPTRGPRPPQPPRRDGIRPVPVRRGPDGDLPPRPPRPGAPRTSATHHAAPPPAAPVDPVSQGRSRLLHAFWPPRVSRNQLVVGVLLACLGAALAIQVRATNSTDQLLRAARPDDLVHILDEVTARGQRLDTELRDLESQKAALQNSTDKAQAALQQAQEKAKDLQLLAGTTKATGPGITVTITDPQGKVNAAALLNALQELRAAGAEVVQLGNVRIVVSSAFLDTSSGQVSVDGHVLTAPYVFKVIGDPATLKPALGIPGGVVESLRGTYGATTTITSGQILVDAVAPVPDPQYAKAG